MSRETRRGVCRVCLRSIGLRVNGTLHAHGFSVIDYTQSWCRGSGLFPADGLDAARDHDRAPGPATHMLDHTPDGAGGRTVVAQLIARWVRCDPSRISNTVKLAYWSGVRDGCEHALGLLLDVPRSEVARMLRTGELHT